MKQLQIFTLIIIIVLASVQIYLVQTSVGNMYGQIRDSVLRKTVNDIIDFSHTCIGTNKITFKSDGYNSDMVVIPCSYMKAFGTTTPIIFK